MKYEDKVHKYINEHDALPTSEEARLMKSDALEVTITKMESGKSPILTALANAETNSALVKKKRGRPAGSKNNTKKRPGPQPGSIRRTVPNESRLLVRMTQKLSDILHTEAEENFRGPGQEVNFILTQHYKNNGKL
jgi:hypothetical protein